MYHWKSITFVIFVLCLSLFISMPRSISQNKFYTKRVNNELRKGPANYYPLIGIIPQNTLLTCTKMEDGWSQVLLDDDLAKLLGTQRANAWVSKNCLLERPIDQEHRQLNISTNVSTPSSVAAAIRGFALRFHRTSLKNIDAFLVKNHPCFTHDEYNAFLLESGLTPATEIEQALQEKYAGLFNEYDVSLNETMIGFNIAAEIASRGLMMNPSLEKYLNLLGTLITQHSNAYDRFFRIYVLTSSTPEAYSTPGGIIFISLGLIRACSSEAELAAVLAHEMTHVIQHHGSKEMQKRSNKIRAEEAFAELEETTGKNEDSTETALEEYIQEAYDSVVKPHLIAYEEDADRGAVVFLAQAGYDPNAVMRIINKIPAHIPAQENDLEENPFMKRDYDQRYQSAASFIHEYFRQTRGSVNMNRFEKYCQGK